MAKQIFSMDFYGKKIQVEVGEMAKQANGSCLVRYDDTVVLSTACAGKEPKDVDFFPLTVTYEEKLYSVGKIPGGFLKREGRPSEHGTLTARMIDRPIRPLFADGFRNEVQVVNTVLSVDQEATPEMAAMLGASIALCISDIPFNGPIAGVNVGLIDGEFTVNAGPEDMARSEINLEVAGTKDAINMVEADAKEVDEETMLNALMFGHEKIKELIAFQEQIVEAVGKEKIDVPLFALDENIVSSVEAMAKEEMVKAISIPGKLERYAAIDELDAKVVESFEEKEYATVEEHDKTIKQVKMVLGDLEKEEVRRLITEEKVRPDGRKVDEVRPLDAQVDLLPRVHGSAMFTRGETQVLSACTLGALGEVQKIDGLDANITTKRYIHQYNFPAYSVGETKVSRGPGRREIGHGALAEKALVAVLPSEEEFPYAIRAVSETFESNGSTSMASTCASCMALMAAGVPIKSMVAGISCGLVTGDTDDDYIVLTDIQGLEDFFGDMDFKVTGTHKGITAIQMDIKIHGLTRPIVEEAIARTREARLYIMDEVMSKAISKPRKEVGAYAPKIIQIQIDPNKIGDVVGQKGKTINEIIARTDVKIDITDEGAVSVCGTDKEKMAEAIDMIKTITTDFEEGQIFTGTVVSIKEFGAFIEFAPGKEGMVHISKISKERINRVEDVLTLGDKVTVVCLGKDKMGRISFSMKDVPENN